MKLLKMRSHCNDNFISVNLSIKGIAYSFDYTCHKQVVDLSNQCWHNPEIPFYTLPS